MMATRLVLILLSMAIWVNCSTTSQDKQTTTQQPASQQAKPVYGQINQEIPPFQTKTIQGQTVDRAYFNHKVTLINFMYIGCQPCMQEAPLLNQLFQEIRLSAFQMLCIAPQTLQQMKKLYPYAIPYSIIAECPNEDVLGGPSGPGCRSLSDLFSVRGYPTTLLVDSKGIVRYRHLGFSSQHPPDLKAELKTLLDKQER